MAEGGFFSFLPIPQPLSHHTHPYTSFTQHWVLNFSFSSILARSPISLFTRRTPASIKHFPSFFSFQPSVPGPAPFLTLTHPCTQEEAPGARLPHKEAPLPKHHLLVMNTKLCLPALDASI